MQTPPLSGELFLCLQLTPSSQKDVTQSPGNGLFLVTSVPSLVTFHTAKQREQDTGPLPGSPRTGLSEPGSLHAAKRNPPCSTQGTRMLVQKVAKYCLLLFGAAMLKGDPAKHAFSSKVVLQFICSKGESEGGHRKGRNKNISLNSEFATACAEVLLTETGQ